MYNIKQLLEDIIAKYKDVPALMNAVMGEKEAIFYVGISRPLSPNQDEQYEMAPWPSIVASHQITDLGQRGNITQWRHRIRVEVRLTDDLDYPTVISALVNGVPQSGDGFDLMQCSFNEYVDSMEEVIFTVEVDLKGKSFYRMEYNLQERGGF